MNRARYRLTFIDMATGKVILVRGSDYPEYRAYVRGLPVRIVCDEIEEVPALAPVYAMAA